jgi:aldehyde:ferredoxin oxidoreductase
VRYATLSHDGRHAGRGGSGAVLGAKNIKAIAVRGTARCTWAHPGELAALAKRISEKSFGPETAKYRELGTVSNLLVFNRLNALPVRNFQQGSFEGAAALAPETLDERREIRTSCVACTIGCEHIYSFSGQGKTRGRVRLEYESLFSLGPLCGVGDPDAVLQASQLCDELGLDTISAGGTIAFAMECVERGLLDAPWLRFGDGPQVKGLEIPGYEPRGLQTMALGFAVGSRGADHNRSGAYEVDFSSAVDRRNPGAGAALLAIETEDRAALMDSLILCKFLRGIFVDFFEESAEILRLVTGWDVNADELRATARDLVTRKKRYNIQAGWTPAEDTLPERILRQPLPEDALSSLSAERLAEMIRVYNLGRGWTAEGWLTENEGSAEIHC